MTGRERILATFRGETADTIPFSPNLYQWFYVNHMQGSLPDAIADAQHPFDVLRFLGADILARWDTQWATKELHTAGDYSDSYTGDSSVKHPFVTAFNIYPPHTNQRIRKLETPNGTLTQAWEFSPDASADFETEHWWKTWDDYEAIRFMLETREYYLDALLLHEWVERIGDDGVMQVNITQSPLKTLHWLAGPGNASLFMLDHPAEMQALARIHTEKALAFIEKIVDNPDTEIFIANDNLDSMFYPPYFYKDYCHDYFAKAAEIIHSRGKHLVVHACGRNKKLLPLVGNSKIDCLEGVTPRPIGDVQLGQVREMVGNPNFVVNGGMDAVHQEINTDAEAQIHAYTRALFAEMGDKQRFIFASSCNTSPVTPWQNLVYFRDAAREYGRLSI